MDCLNWIGLRESLQKFLCSSIINHYCIFSQARPLPVWEIVRSFWRCPLLFSHLAASTMQFQESKVVMSFKSAGETNLKQNKKERYRCCITQISSKCLVPLNWETTLSPMTLWNGHRLVHQCCQVWLLRNTWHQKDDIKNNSDGVGNRADIRVTWEHLLEPIGLALRWRSTFETSTNGTRTAQKRKTEWHEKTNVLTCQHCESGKAIIKA